ncbi:MAG: hypothetical protein JWM95_5113 [Gemmatimonadetes bacterium]|nr:hypothetical protein [Gemmatimonadota bacterium]
MAVIAYAACDVSPRSSFVSVAGDGLPPNTRAATCDGMYTVALATAGDAANVGSEMP